MNRKYIAWKTDRQYNQIGDDRVFDAPNTQYVLRLLAFEEKVSYNPNINGKSSIVLPNGDRWNVRILK